MGFIGKLGNYASTIRYGVIFGFSILCWLEWFISTSISQHKSYNRPSAASYFYHSSGHKLYSFVWWAVFYQLFVLGLINTEFNNRFHNNHLATSFTIIALIQSIIVADRYIYSSYKSEVAIGVGALLTAIADFLWLFHYAWKHHVFESRALDEEKSVGFQNNYNGAATAGAAGAGVGAGVGTGETGNRGYEHDRNVTSNDQDPRFFGHNNKERPSISDTHNTHSTAVGDNPNTHPIQQPAPAATVS